MRLQDITLLAENLKDSFNSIKEWKEVQLSPKLRQDLKSIFPAMEKLDEHTGTLSTGVGNITIFPYQYFLICVMIKPLASIIHQYKIVLEKLIEECKNNEIEFAKVVYKKSIGEGDSETEAFDLLISQGTWSENNTLLLVKFLIDEEYRFKGKSIANHNRGQYILRGIEDFFGSFFLQIVNVPNVSSAVLGDLIYHLSENPNIYKNLSEELKPNLLFILKDKTLNNFIWQTLIYLREEQELEPFLLNLKTNSDPKYLSIEKEEHKLTSIFWVFDHLANDEEITQGNKKRCFSEPLFVKDNKHFYLSTEWSNTGQTRLDYKVFEIIFNETYEKSLFVENIGDEYFIKPSNIVKTLSTGKISDYNELISLKTKPFIILAGLSGTGKSRLVRSLAYRFNNITDDRTSKKHPPTNFQLVKVKPNWHDSSELLGYESRISGKDRFIVTDFVRFIIKAHLYPETPFFLLLDEMNLAPVEQYFAEYLSVMETRVLNKEDNKITTDALISNTLFSKYADKPDGVDANFNLWNELDLTDEKIKEELKAKGLTLPPNLIVMGTVNMDETTHSFSRKVLDRAMTIEMNEIDLSAGLDDDADEWDYSEDPISANYILSEKTHGYQVFDELKEDGEKIIKYLDTINEKLEGSPFKIAYRVRDEFLLYAYNYSLIENKPSDWLNKTLDKMTLMKILPRIEGDEDKTKVLEELLLFFDENSLVDTLKKAEEMEKRRKAYHYTSFWT